MARSNMDVASLPTLKELRKHVLKILCANDRLDPEQTPMWQAVIQRRRKPCGLFFQIQGPRQLKTYAIWAGEENRILFYDCIGTRFAEVKLSDAPDAAKLAA